MAARRLLLQEDDFNSDVEQKRWTTSTMMILVGVKCSGASLPRGVTVQSRVREMIPRTAEAQSRKQFCGKCDQNVSSLRQQLCHILGRPLHHIALKCSFIQALESLLANYVSWVLYTQ